MKQKVILRCMCVLLSLVAVTSRAQKVNHPALFFTDKKVQELKQRVKTDATMEAAWNEIRQTADELLQKNDFTKSGYLALAYRMTGERKYADKVKDQLVDQTKRNWSDAEMVLRKPAWRSELQMAHRSFYAAVAYDAVYDALTADERKLITTELTRLAIRPALEDWLLEPTRIHSLNSMGHNWWTSCVCMAGVLSMAFQNEIPEAREWVEQVNNSIPEWFDFPGDELQHKPKTFDASGGMYESVNYANFGISEALLFRYAWQNIHPGKKAPEVPQLSLLPSFFLHICYPRTGMLYDINFGDSHKNITAESSLMLLYAMGIGNSDVLWYLSQVEAGQHRDGLFINQPMGFLLMPDARKAPEVPSLPLSKLYADFGWATLRDSWKKDATMLAVKSGYTWNHSHADANSFILFHKGVDIIKDAGNCWYPRPEYRNYFFQSQAHNVVLFNGQGQSREQQYHGSPLRGYLYHLMDEGNIKYILADGTGPVADNFSRNFRHFLWIDQVIYMVDDLKTHKNGHFEWLWHTNGEVKKRGYDLHVTNGASAVAIRPLYPEFLAKSDFVHDYPNDMYVEEHQGPKEDNLAETETYYSFNLPAEVNRVKGLTVIILKDTPEQKELPVMERIQGENWIGLRSVYQGKVTELYINQQADGRLMHLNSCVNMNGWETDAYMLAVTYPEGAKVDAPKETVVVYGSYLRRDGKSRFASLSKQYFIQKAK